MLASCHLLPFDPCSPLDRPGGQRLCVSPQPALSVNQLCSASSEARAACEMFGLYDQHHLLLCLFMIMSVYNGAAEISIWLFCSTCFSHSINRLHPNPVGGAPPVGGSQQLSRLIEVMCFLSVVGLCRLHFAPLVCCIFSRCCWNQWISWNMVSHPRLLILTVALRTPQSACSARHFQNLSSSSLCFPPLPPQVLFSASAPQFFPSLRLIITSQLIFLSVRCI